MIAMNLVDNIDDNICYGILICNNEEISDKVIQNRIHEIKDNLCMNGEDWVVNDVISCLPKEWEVYFFDYYRKVEI